MKRILSVMLAILIASQIVFPVFAGDGFETEPIPFDVLNEENCLITLEAERFTFAGKPVTPDIKVTFLKEDGTQMRLREGEDYTRTFFNNDKPGKATVRVDGMGLYEGSVNAYFIIVPAKMNPCKIGTKTYKSIQVTFTRVSGAAGYQLCIVQSGTTNYKYYTTDGKKAFTFTSLAHNKTYKIKVRAYVKADEQKYYGTWSDYVSAKTPAAVAAPKVSGYSQLGSQPQLNWKSVKYASKYIVYRATSKNGTYTRIATTKKTFFVDKNAKLYKTYYYAVRSYAVRSQKGYYSVLSNKVKFKATKSVMVGT